MTENEQYIHRRSSERLRYAVDVAHKSVNDAFKIFSLGKRPYHQLFSDVCQDINAQLDTLNLLVQPLLDAAPKYDFEDVEGNGIRSVLGVVDCALKELIDHLKYCAAKHSSFFFNGTNAAAKLSRFCTLLSKLGKLLDVATLMHQQLGGKVMFLELDNPVGAVCMRELDSLARECFYGQLVAFHFAPSIRNVMKGICVALSSYGIGYYTDVPVQLGQPQSLIWRSSASIFSGARYWFKEEERARKFVELTHSCASVAFTKSFWNLVENGILAEVPKLVNRHIEIAVEIFIDGEPLYVRNKFNQMILIHPPVGKQGFAGVTVGFLSARLREGQLIQVTTPANAPELPTPTRFPKSRRLLVHFHGGGFVSGSHVQHEAYLRGWCSELDAIVVSINYSLAPENPFPKGLDDCIFAYAWCLENLHTLGCTGESIVFMGDSAGGNLALTTAMRANSYGLRCPDGIVAVYPVTYVKYAGSVSRLMSAMDILLPSGVLQCCLRAYSGVPVDSNDMFYDWMQTAKCVPAENTTDTEQTISELNSKYISEIAGSGNESRYVLPSTPNMPSLVETPTTEQQNGLVSTEDIVLDDVVGRDADEPDLGVENSMPSDGDPPDDVVELDKIRINPVVFDQSNIAKLLAEEENTGNMKGEGEEVNEERSTKEAEKEEVGTREEEEETSEEAGEMTSSKLDEESAHSEQEGAAIEHTIANNLNDVGGNTDEPAGLEDGTKDSARLEGDRNESVEVEGGTNDGEAADRVRSVEGDANELPEEDRNEPEFTDIMNHSKDDDLERMLYDDCETRFKGAKLVLKRLHDGNRVQSTPDTPVTPSNVEPNPLGKMATVIQEHESYGRQEPAYIINPGEIATRKNITLLQKYFDDPFMSPYLADQETLLMLPPIHVIAAELDPLLDDSVSFCKKVKAAGGTISLEVVPGMTHGFLNLVLSNSTCAAAAKRCLVAISKHFARSEEVQ